MSLRFTFQLSIIVFVLTLSTLSIAGSWDPPAESDLNWCDSVNWGFFGVPTSTDTVTINSTPEGPARIGTGCYADAASLIISQFGNDAAVKVYPGASLHVYGDTILGNYSGLGMLEIHDDVAIDGNLTVGYHFSGGEGILKMHGGVLSLAGDVDLGDQGGDGTLEMTGGVMDITGELGMLNGQIQVNGGIIYADNLSFITPYGTFDIRGEATVILWRDLSDYIGHSISNITACNGQGTVIKDFYSNATVIRTECTCPDADITGDCLVDLGDLAALADQWLDGVG